MDLAGRRPRWPIAQPEAFRAELRNWIQDNWDLQVSVGEWWDRLASTGLTAPTWPRSQAGLAATTAIQTVIEEELAKVGAIAPPVLGDGIPVVGAALRQYATPEQFAALAPRLLTGLDWWAVLISEPGNDNPAMIKCAATFDWKYVTLNGDKSSGDVAATKGMVLARSQPESTGRDGLTWFFVDLSYQTIDPAGTVELRDVRMEHDSVLGARDDGWTVAQAILPFRERSFAGRIRRGLVHVKGGDKAGNLRRIVGDVIADARARAEAGASAHSGIDRRGR